MTSAAPREETQNACAQPRGTTMADHPGPEELSLLRHYWHVLVTAGAAIGGYDKNDASEG